MRVEAGVPGELECCGGEVERYTWLQIGDQDTNHNFLVLVFSAPGCLVDGVLRCQAQLRLPVEARAGVTGNRQARSAAALTLLCERYLCSLAPTREAVPVSALCMPSRWAHRPAALDMAILGRTTWVRTEARHVLRLLLFPKPDAGQPDLAVDVGAAFIKIAVRLTLARGHGHQNQHLYVW